MVTPKKEHILLAEEMGDKIYSMDNKFHMEILAAIHQRVIDRKLNSVDELRKFNKQ